MTYLPQVEIPKWMGITNKAFSYLFFILSYSLVACIFLQIFNLFIIPIAVDIVISFTLVVLIITIAHIESKIYPYPGW
jgi:hypothetical protein